MISELSTHGEIKPSSTAGSSILRILSLKVVFPLSSFPKFVKMESANLIVTFLRVNDGLHELIQ